MSFISSCSRSPANQYCNGPRTPPKPQHLSTSRMDPRRKSSMKPKNPSPDGVSSSHHRNRESKFPSTKYPLLNLLNPDFGIFHSLHRGETALFEPQPQPNQPPVPSPLACRPGALVSTFAASHETSSRRSNQSK